MSSSLSSIANRVAPISGFWMPPEIREFVRRIPKLPPIIRRSLARHAGMTFLSTSEVASYVGILPRLDCRRRKLGPQRRRDYIMIASLMCKHRCRPSNCLFSTSLRRLQAKVECRSLVSQLAGADRNCLPVALDVAIDLMSRHGVPVGWYSLLYDVLRFNHPDKFVQKSWSSK